MARVLGAFRAAVEEHLPVTVINDWNLKRRRPRPLQGADPAQHGLPRRGAGRGRRAVRPRRRRAGGQPRHVALRRVRQPRAEFRAWPTSSASTTAGIPDDRRASTRETSTSISPRRSGPTTGKNARTSSTSSRIRCVVPRTRAGWTTSATAVTSRGPPLGSARRVKRPRSSGTLRIKSPRRRCELPGVVARTLRQGTGRLTSRPVSTRRITSTPTLTSACVLAMRSTGPPPSRSPIVVEAPMCVHSTLMRQTKDAADRLVVHLFSDLNTTAFHALPVDDVPLREEVVPIHDIKVSFRRVITSADSSRAGGARPGSQETPADQRRRPATGNSCDGRCRVGRPATTLIHGTYRYQTRGE